jgi:predicted acyl esterase
VRVRLAAVTSILVAALLSGCAKTPGVAFPEPPRGDPFPEQAYWPDDLPGPFAVDRKEHFRVKSHDGVELDGHVWLPRVPDGVKVPVVLHSTPYTGVTAPPADANVFLDALDVRWIVQAGYAFADVNVRGTGESGGCFDLWGPDEQKDQPILVEWLAQQPWSNGRVGMYGISWMGTTPWMAANAQTPSLKTIVAAGIISDVYLTAFSPQGAANQMSALYTAAVSAALTWAPLPVYGAMSAGTDKPSHLSQYALVAPERLCPEVAMKVTADQRSAFSSRREAAFFEERRLIDGFPNITTAVLVAHGLKDVEGHAFQEEAVWQALPNAPKRMMFGNWGHEFPTPAHLRGYGHGTNWSQVVLPWLDYWLKGVGDEAPRLGIVDYFSARGNWRQSDAWPPAESREEVLYLTQGRLGPSAGGQQIVVEARTNPTPMDCMELWRGRSDVAVAVSEPLREDVVVAGNPFAFLEVVSTQPGGLLNLDLVSLDPSGSCGSAETPSVRWMSRGSVDLRFYQGGYDAVPLAVNSPTPIRVDFMGVADHVPAGHQLAVVVHGPDADPNRWGSAGEPYVPTVRLGTSTAGLASHVVVPLVEGSLGGLPPGSDYPLRPRTPLVQ